jgi:hypothetical protein
MGVDIDDLTNQILLLDCGVPVSDERSSSEIDLGFHVRFLLARIAVAARKETLMIKVRCW